MPDVITNGHAPAIARTMPPHREATPPPVVVPRPAPQPLPEVRSDEVQEILSYVPHWMVRWGLSTIFAVVVLLLVLSWVIRYPDVIKGDFTLTAENPPVRLAANSPGKLTRLYFQDGESVPAGALIAEVESPVEAAGLAYLRAYLEAARRLPQRPATLLPVATEPWVYGSLQGPFNSLQKACHSFQQWSLDAFEVEVGANLREKIGQYEQLLIIQTRQEALAQAELANAEAKYETSQLLYADSIISRAEYYREESQFRAKALELENLRKTGTLDRITLTDLRKQLLEWEQAREEKARTYTEEIRLALAEVENGLRNWRQGYQVIAPAAGRLEMLGEVVEGQYVQPGQELFALMPAHGTYTGLVKAPAQGYGKIAPGQRVRIRLDNFPYHQYGLVEGEVARIAALPEEKFYRVEVDLPAGLRTQYGHELPFSPHMTGSAEVITEDLRVIDRFFYQFRKLIP